MSFCETSVSSNFDPEWAYALWALAVLGRLARAPRRHARARAGQREFHSAPVSRGVSTRFRHNRQRTFRGVPARDARRGACASGAGGVVRVRVSCTGKHAIDRPYLDR